MQMEMYTMEIGKMIKHMEKENIYIKILEFMKVNGMKINNKEKEQKHFWMELFLLVDLMKV